MPSTLKTMALFYYRQHALLLLLAIMAFVTENSFAQIKNIGLPFVNNYTREQYNAESQNWDIDQDSKGIMYFANNQGLLVYNGNDWKTYPISNKSIVRSILADNGRIYAGGYNEFGYFEHNEKGKLEYKSLSEQLNEQSRSFDEIWRIFNTTKGIVFQSYLNVFIYNGHSIRVLDPRSKFGFSYYVDDTLFVVDREFGLYTLSNERLVPYITETNFFLRNEITFIVKTLEHSLLMGTTNNGIFELSRNGIKPWQASINQRFVKNQIYCGIPLSHNQLAIGTIQDGVYIMDTDGNLLMHLNRQRGLQNNTVLSLFFDKYSDLWLGFDNGLAMLEVNSPLTLLDYSYNIETSYATAIFNNRLYVGTNQGLFTKSMSEFNNDALNNSGFEKIEGTLGQVWKLKTIENKLFCGHNFGTFIIDGTKAHLISEKPGGWDYELLPWNHDIIVEGNYSGLNLFKRSNNQIGWVDAGFIKGFTESSKELMFDDRNTLWIEHGIKGLFKVVLAPDGHKVESVTQYFRSNGLPELPYSLVKIKGRVFVLAENLLYEYNYNENKFIQTPELNQLMADFPNIAKIIEAGNGDLWIFSRTNTGVLRQQEDGTYTSIIKPFCRIKNQFLKGSFENISWFDSQNTFIGGQMGLIHYALQTQKDYAQPYEVYIDEIIIKSRKASSEGESNTTNELFLNPNTQYINIPYKNNSISFRFFTPFYEATNETRYSFRLKGFDNEWSEWNSISFKEYTNLHEGKYTFEVKAKNIYDNESQLCSYAFIVKPPAYRTQLAYLLYLITIAGIVMANVIYFKHKIDKTRAIEAEKLASAKKVFKQEVKINEQKIEQLEQEKMKSEMQLKNIELANSTMNLIQKNKLLNSIKKELSSVSGKAKSDQVKIDIKQLIAKIDKDINHDQNFKVFDKYFDRVHQDFINRLREKHPQLTAKDLRLCAYLRMNLSTKEIAPLMNVSTRGLEISRYRLRKKLDIDRDINLVDYIMGL